MGQGAESAAVVKLTNECTYSSCVSFPLHRYRATRLGDPGAALWVSLAWGSTQGRIAPKLAYSARNRGGGGERAGSYRIQYSELVILLLQYSDLFVIV